jgi:hypothetical protein
MCLIFTACGQNPSSKDSSKTSSSHPNKPKVERYNAIDANDAQEARELFAHLDENAVRNDVTYEGIDAVKELQVNFSTMLLADSPLRPRLAKICLEIESGWEKLKAKGRSRPAVENGAYIGLVTLDRVVCKHRYIQTIN